MKDGGSVFDGMVKPDWNATWDKIGTKVQHQVECDDRESIMTVVIDDQGDAHLDLMRHPKAVECGGGFGRPTFRARTFQGGGRNERVRQALIMLALAIVEDCEQTARSGEAACSVESTTHEVIEAKLLHALADTDKVALVVTRDDLDLLIEALKCGRGYGLRVTQMETGLRQLRAAAFPPNTEVSIER